jgi:hypothetical protein
MEDGIGLDAMPEGFKKHKSSASKAMFNFLHKRLHYRIEEDLPFNTIDSLITACGEHIISVERTLASVSIQALRSVLQRMKPGWGIRQRDIEHTPGLLRQFLVQNGLKDSLLQDVVERMERVRDKFKEFVGLGHRPILLLSDSMFMKLKPSKDILPLAYSGQRAEDLRWVLEHCQVRAEISDVVLNHGLNHTRHYGDPLPHMEAVYKWLSNQYPMARLFHLEPPRSPELIQSPAMYLNTRKFADMMVEIGFTRILHPSLPREAFDRDRFHYSQDGMRSVMSSLKSEKPRASYMWTIHTPLSLRLVKGRGSHTVWPD